MNRFPLILFLLMLTMLAELFMFLMPAGEHGQVADERAVSAAVPSYGDVRGRSADVLCAAFSSSPPAQQLVIHRMLYGTGDEECFSGLCREALQKGTVYDRITALAALFESPQGKDELILLCLHDCSYVVRERALYHLSLTGDKRWLFQMRKALDDEDYYVRATAARALGRLGDKDSADALLALSGKEAGWARLCVLQGLAMLDHVETKAVLAGLAAKSPSQKERAYSAGMLYEAGDRSMLPVLKELMRSPDDRAREIACRYLVRLAPPEESDIITAIVAKGDIHALRSALEKMRNLEPEAARKILRRARMCTADKRGELLTLFGDKEPDRAHILEVALDLRGDDLLALLTELLYGTDEKRGRAMMEFLLADERIKKNNESMANLADVLGRKGLQDDIMLLVPLLEHDSLPVRIHAAGALLAIMARQEHQSGEAGKQHRQQGGSGQQGL